MTQAQIAQANLSNAQRLASSVIASSKLQTISQNLAKLEAGSDKAQVVSFGAHTGTKSFINETSKAIDFGFTIKNRTNKDLYIAISPGAAKFTKKATGGQSFYSYAFLYNDSFATSSEVDPSKVGADCFLYDGNIYDIQTGTTPVVDNLCTVETMNAKRSISEMLGLAKTTPFRFTGFTMSSYNVEDGTPESTNYNNSIKTIWKSPFEDTVSDEFSLRNIVRDKYQLHLLDLDFQKNAPNLKAIVSNEHFIILKVNAGTMLDINAHIGAQLSLPQYLYRIVKGADNVMRKVRQGL